ncbi:MAG TPA: copper homeostasis periplasmic binding protein CopC [Aliidongia sp.]|uniref:copper homeostasis periplasmic binding protein CopC n=1 Tax=Aliidongia sp. TaxID=1914230 RepID=UPI002DDD0810|nr:copper homeostasis periplasmic binding protein CopC [Aliidongia sp.]HEV2673743.1 copper homeostasis periplasmic binding protein CopC [Aliidongia sp.]
MTHRIRVLAFVLGLLLAFSGQAFAHAMLETAAPSAGSTVATPDEIRLGFTEALEPRFSSITVTDAAGKPIAAPKAAPDPADAKVLELHPSAPLAPGRYHVAWAVVSVDTHRTQGGFDFTVQP